MSMFNRVLVATDLTAISRPALALGARLVQASSGTLFVVHADELPETAKHWLTPFYEEDVEALRAFVERHGTALRTRLTTEIAEVMASMGSAGAVATEPIFRWGRPADTIVAEGQRLDADVIVAGTRGSPVGRVLERVLLTAGRPVLAVPGLTSMRG
jgi:nucleotide-binding universal stress UspA family protein